MYGVGDEIMASGHLQLCCSAFNIDVEASTPSILNADLQLGQQPMAGRFAPPPTVRAYARCRLAVPRTMHRRLTAQRIADRIEELMNDSGADTA